jgi:hypothetical protein
MRSPHGRGKKGKQSEVDSDGENPLTLDNKVERCTFIIFDFFPRLFSVLVKEAFVPSIWVPPSTVRMLLAYPSIVSEYASEHLVQNKKN